MIGRLLFVLLTSCIAFTAYAGKATIAPEATFLVPGVDPGAYPPESLVYKVVRDLAKRCKPQCARSWTSFIISGTPIQIEITTDENVFEAHITDTKLNNLTIEDFEKYEAIIEEVLYKGMRSLGYAPHPVIGAGHLNVGVESAFSGNIRHLKNFLSLVMNDQSLPLIFGSYEHDYLYATPIQHFPLAAQNRIANILNEDKPRETTESVMSQISKEFAVNHPVDPSNRSSFIKQKFVAVSMRDFDVASKRRLEIRTMRPQQSFKQFILQAKLYQALIDYAEQLTTKGTKLDFVPSQPNLVVEDALRDFRNLVEKLRMSPRDFSSFIAPPWKQAWEQELSSRSKSCNALL